MLLGVDIGFGFSKTVTRGGADAFPSVVADWAPTEFEIGDGFGRADLEALGYQGRQYLVGERALKVGTRLFVGLSREWLETVPYRLLTLHAIRHPPATAQARPLGRGRDGPPGRRYRPARCDGPAPARRDPRG